MCIYIYIYIYIHIHRCTHKISYIYIVHTIYSIIKYYTADQIKKNEMGGACSTYGGLETRILGFCVSNLRERDHLKDVGVNGKTISKRIVNKSDGDMGRAQVGRGRSCECGNEPSTSIKSRKFLD